MSAKVFFFPDKKNIVLISPIFLSMWLFYVFYVPMWFHIYVLKICTKIKLLQYYIEIDPFLKSVIPIIALIRKGVPFLVDSFAFTTAS